MRFLFITLFPEQIEQAVSHSIIKRGIDKGLIEVSCINPREQNRVSFRMYGEAEEQKELYHQE